jgi:hypothetical protein
MGKKKKEDELCEEFRAWLKDGCTLPEYIHDITDEDEAVRRAGLELARYAHGFILDHHFKETGQGCLPEDFKPERFLPAVIDYVADYDTGDCALDTITHDEAPEIGAAFLVAYNKVADPYFHDPLDVAFRRAQRTVSNGGGYYHPIPGVKLVAEIAKELQAKNSKHPIYLPQLRFAVMMGVKQQSVSRYIQILIGKGKLKLVRRGSKESKEASRYWYNEKNEEEG